jgi:alkylation response protein AidB-like acyl-CoA dehydrogenase
MDLPGVQVRPLLYMNGKHVYNEVFFNDVKIPADDLIGVEGEGWALTRQTMNFEHSGAGGFSGAKRYLEQLIECTTNTIRNGKPLSKDPRPTKSLGRIRKAISRV